MLRMYDRYIQDRKNIRQLSDLIPQKKNKGWMYLSSQPTVSNSCKKLVVPWVVKTTGAKDRLSGRS